jgi:hypothetical protein
MVPADHSKLDWLELRTTYFGEWNCAIDLPGVVNEPAGYCRQRHLSMELLHAANWFPH